MMAVTIVPGTRGRGITVLRSGAAGYLSVTVAFAPAVVGAAVLQGGGAADWG